MSASPLIVGAGPAGSAAAIRLARAGANPVLIDRDEAAKDAICGGFLSWRTAQALRELGFDPDAAGAAPVRRLALFAGGREAVATLPSPAFGLSRRTMDGALRDLAARAGARIEIDLVRAIEQRQVKGEARTYESEAIFLASGKTDVRGEARPREDDDPALGLRLHARADEGLARRIADRIELHLFDGGYAGIVMQEGGRANICLAVRKSLLTRAGGDPRALLARLAADHPHFGERFGRVAVDAPLDTIAAVPYGWRAERGRAGLFRLGDQAAVIPSLAGEGMGIALASARAAVDAYARGGAAAGPAYQEAFAARSRRPLGIAGLLWRVGETARGGPVLRAATAHAPALAHLAMRLSRI